MTDLLLNILLLTMILFIYCGNDLSFADERYSRKTREVPLLME